MGAGTGKASDDASRLRRHDLSSCGARGHQPPLWMKTGLHIIGVDIISRWARGSGIRDRRDLLRASKRRGKTVVPNGVAGQEDQQPRGVNGPYQERKEVSLLRISQARVHFPPMSRQDGARVQYLAACLTGIRRHPRNSLVSHTPPPTPRSFSCHLNPHSIFHSARKVAQPWKAAPPHLPGLLRCNPSPCGRARPARSPPANCAAGIITQLPSAARSWKKERPARGRNPRHAFRWTLDWVGGIWRHGPIHVPRRWGAAGRPSSMLLPGAPPVFLN